MVSNVKRKNCVTKLHGVILSLVVVIFSITSQAHEITNDNFLNNLKRHYQATNLIDKFSISYESAGESVNQSYDFNKPTKIFSRKELDFDVNKESYFLHNTRGPFPGDFIFETKEFQKNMKRYRYDINGVLYGKRVLELDTKFGFQHQLDDLIEVMDIFVVKIMLDGVTNGSSVEVKIDEMSNHVIVEQKHIRLGKLTYNFQLKPLKLISLYNKRNDQLFTYSHRVLINGIDYASRVNMKEGKYERDFLIETFTKNMGIEAAKFDIPMGYGPIVANDKKELKTEMIAENLYLISNVNDRYIAFKVNDKGIMVFGAPGSDQMSEKVMAHINEQFPMKSINTVYITHHHNDHIGGLNAYAQKGITILADAFSITAIKAYRPFTENIAKFNFRAFEHKELIDGVRFYIPENSHAKGQSFAYFEQSQIIYEGDLLEIPFDNTIASYMSETEKQFVEFVRKENLEIKRIIGHHRNGNISPEVMNAYYQANVGMKTAKTMEVQ
jgi:glyoxylase-like metal-dependent hydrolase (beta-lactamase superfamily II)